jgi:hypothetical protein
MIVYGGMTDSGVVGEAAAYDPAADAWTLLDSPDVAPRIHAAGLQAGASGTIALFWGGANDVCDHCYPIEYMDGGAYDAASGAWTLIPDLTTSPIGPSIRSGSAVWWGAGRLWLWGGSDLSTPASTLARFDPPLLAKTGPPPSGEGSPPTRRDLAHERDTKHCA